MVGVIFSIFLFIFFFFFCRRGGGWPFYPGEGGGGWRILLVVGFGPSFVDSPVFSLRFFAFRFKLCLWVTWDFSRRGHGVGLPILPWAVFGPSFLHVVVVRHFFWEWGIGRSWDWGWQFFLAVGEAFFLGLEVGPS